MSEARIHNPITCSGKEYWVPHDVACHISELITRLADSEKALREAQQKLADRAIDNP